MKTGHRPVALFAANVRISETLKRAADLADQIAVLRGREIDTVILEMSLKAVEADLERLQEAAMNISMRSR